MEAAVLCTGPSLQRFLDAPPKHDLYIGVNRAAEAYRCDWWVFNDSEAFHQFGPIGISDIFTSEASRSEVFRRYKDLAPRYWLTWEGVDTDCPCVFKRFSMLSAIVLAVHLGATRIVIYGCDWQGVEDWDGQVRQEGRTPYRWGNEQHAYSQVEAWLQTKSVSIERKIMAKPQPPKPSEPTTDAKADADAPPVPGDGMPSRKEVEEADEARAAASEAHGPETGDVRISRLYLRQGMQVGNVNLPAGSPVAEVALPDYGHNLNWLGHAIKTDLLTDVDPDSTP